MSGLPRVSFRPLFAYRNALWFGQQRKYQTGRINRSAAMDGADKFGG